MGNFLKFLSVLFVYIIYDVIKITFHSLFLSTSLNLHCTINCVSMMVNKLPREFLKKPSVDPKSSGGVCRLSKESGGQPRVHANDAFFFQNSLDGMEAGFVFLGCTTSST